MFAADLRELNSDRYRSKPLMSTSLDLSTGFTLPLYDIDTDLLYLTCRVRLTLAAVIVSR